jgi:polyisoprenoid-binding protein YceI
MLKETRTLVLMTVLYLLCSNLQTAQGLECHVDKSRERLVKFISDATFEDFEGVTEKIDGYAYWSGDSLTTGDQYPNSKIYFEVRLDALDTGIGMRNADMREDYLETEMYPCAKYDAKITSVESTGDGSFKVNAAGDMTIHGVSQQMPITAKVTRSQDGYHVTCDFTVKLQDFDIDIPRLLFMRVSETIELESDYYLTIVKESESGDEE